MCERIAAAERTVDPVLRAADLYLACACTLGVPAAVEALVEQHLAMTPAYVSHLKLPAADLDELGQHLRAQLLVATPGRRARIAEYTGSGSLSGWLRSMAVHAAIDLLRKKGREPDLDGDTVMDVVAESDSPELDVIKSRHGRDLEQAMRDALLTLEPEQRRLLRHYHRGRQTVTRLGELYGVHHSAISRRLEVAETALGRRTFKLLRERLKLNNEDARSLARFVRSQLQVDLSALFADSR